MCALCLEIELGFSSFNRLHAPIRAVFERSEDTVNIGGRHPFKGIYKVLLQKKLDEVLCILTATFDCAGWV